MVTIKKSKYNKLIADHVKLEALMAAGVDNWDEYDYAIKLSKICGTVYVMETPSEKSSS